jgi:hypothetical protein
MMQLLRRLVTALERLADAWDEQNDFDRESSTASEALQREQTQMLNRVQDVQQEQLKRAEEWRAIEREHMKVCEKRFLQRQLDDVVKDEPIRH